MIYTWRNCERKLEMRRTKEWWRRLSDDERALLIALERANAAGTGSGSAYLPEGFADCPFCSTPTHWGGLCSMCNARLDGLIQKASKEVCKCEAQ